MFMAGRPWPMAKLPRWSGFGKTLEASELEARIAALESRRKAK